MDDFQLFEVHYHLKDGTHWMDAVIRNKCEAESLAAFSYMAAQLGFEVAIETSGYADGGLRQVWKFYDSQKGTILVAGALLAAGPTLLTQLVNTATTIWVAPAKPDKEIERLQKELLEESVKEKRLANQKLVEELSAMKAMPRPALTAPSTAASAARIPSPSASSTTLPPAQLPVVKGFRTTDEYSIFDYFPRTKELSLQTDPKVLVPRSNFYKLLSSTDKVTGVGYTAMPDRHSGLSEVYVSRAEFANFMFPSEALDPEFRRGVTIELISPVIIDSDARWRGIFEGKRIGFEMKDSAFKEAVLNRTVKFQSGDRIVCDLKVDRKYDEGGEIKISGYSVLTVLDRMQGDKVIETPQGRQKRFADKHAKDGDLFTEEE